MTLITQAKVNLKEYFPEQVEISFDYDCPHCFATASENTALKELIGRCKSQSPYTYAVFECQICFEKYRHHIGHSESDEGFLREVAHWRKRNDTNTD